MFARIKKIGPGALIAAAFIGPGTITTSSLAGASFSYTLAWVLVFATLSTIILQEMAARLGVVSQQGLGSVLLQELSHSWLRWPLITLLLMALYAGNVAYEGGNIAGAASGLSVFLNSDFLNSDRSFNISVYIISVISALLLLIGKYKLIQNALIALVLIMTIAFISTFVLVDAKLFELLKASARFEVPQGSLLTITALIGTTIVPYNLFLHASIAKSNWQECDLKTARLDTTLSIGIGGLIAILIMSTAAAGIYQNALSVNNVSDMAVQLEPIFGQFAPYLFGIGLFSAGLSSAITAPLATALVVTEVLNLNSDSNAKAVKFIAVSVLALGTFFALSGIKPLKLIVMAQFANGLLLPIIACFLLYAMNKRAVLGAHTNGFLANILGAIVVVITITLGAKSILAASGFI